MNRRTRIKMCGMTREEDLLYAASLGVDAIGLVFYPPSPRAISIETGAMLSRKCPVLTDRVALFVNPEVELVHQVIDEVGIDLIQFHGDETPEFCHQFGLPYIKAIRAESKETVESAVALHKDADALMLDAFVKGVPGGTGQMFDWSMIPDGIAHKLFLAGGLNPETVKEAITGIRPFVVDVSGGIEASKGIKSAEKMQAFYDAVAQADLTNSEISS